jgi:hypothetical protein
MPAVRLPLTSLTDGVSTQPMPLRTPGSVKVAENTMMRRIRGCEKRPGSELVQAPTASYNLDATNPTQAKAYHWIDRDEDEKFLVLIDPANAGNARIECFTLITRGTGAGTPTNEVAGQEIALTVTNHSSGTNPLDYISAAGTTTARRRFRALTVADVTVIANRDVSVGLTGAAITYRDAALSLIRSTTHSQNKPSWNDLPQPPTGTAAAGVTDSNFIYYTRDNDLGWPAGWYRASSTTQPPWYTRIRTEPANSLINWANWPIRLNFDGTSFNVVHPAWIDRYSGDSFTNPGPQLASGPSAPHQVRDLCFFQSRLWFGGYEFLDSSQNGDVFNLWNTSYVGLTDVDPVNVSMQSDAVTVVDFIIPFDGGIVVLTRGGRQFEVKSQGAMTPSTVSIIPTTSYQTVDYCAPAKLGNQLYFLAEQNGAMVVYEYVFQQDRGSNVATNATGNVEGYIPDDAMVVRTSAQNDMLFVLTSGDQTSLYVCQMEWKNGQNEQRAWQKWTFNDPIQDCQVFGSTLYIVFLRNNRLYLEKVNIDLPDDDDDGLTPATVNGYSGSGDMQYAIRLDSRASYQGSYNSGTNTTTWTIPYEDADIDTVVLGQLWDNDYEFPPASGTFHQQRRKGKILIPATEGGTLTIAVGAGSTTISCSGNFATNGQGTNSPCWIGIRFTKRVRLNELFVRQSEAPDAAAVAGLVQYKHLMMRLVNTGNLRVEITPQGRDAVTFEYVKDVVGQSLLGQGLSFEEYDEFNLPCLGAATTTQIDFVNDSPYPSRIIGGEMRAGFVPAKTDPTRR